MYLESQIDLILGEVYCQFLGADVVYFDQLLGDACTRKLVETLFWAVFNLFCSFLTFFSDFSSEIKKKHFKTVDWKNIVLSYSLKYV